MSRARLQSQNRAVTRYFPACNLDVTIQRPQPAFLPLVPAGRIDNPSVGFQYLIVTPDWFNGIWCCQLLLQLDWPSQGLRVLVGRRPPLRNGGNTV
jgi:hypothetical protein